MAVKLAHNKAFFFFFDGVGLCVCVQSGGSNGVKEKKTGSSNQQVDWNVT
jgi:hypothetical protein